MIAALEEHASDKEYDDFAEFTKKLKEILGDIEGMTDSRLNQIAMEMSVMDKTAVVQKDKKGNVLTDPTTKDTEIIGLRVDVEEYFKREVYPHVPDAIYVYEYDPNKKASSTNKEKMGAEFPFTRYFYEYKAPEKADDLLAQFNEIERGLETKIRSPNGRWALMAEMKPSGIAWIGNIPAIGK